MGQKQGVYSLPKHVPAEGQNNAISLLNNNHLKALQHLTTNSSNGLIWQHYVKTEVERMENINPWGFSLIHTLKNVSNTLKVKSEPGKHACTSQGGAGGILMTAVQS